MITTTTPAPLTALDRCDRCGAAAKMRAVLPSGGELLFCGHHARRHAVGLAGIVIEVHSADRALLDAISEPPAAAA